LGCGDKQAWDASWKLAHQAASAGLLLTDRSTFDISQFPGYEVTGGRGGHGGGFHLGDAEMYTMMKPGVKRKEGIANIFAIFQRFWRVLETGGDMSRTALAAPLYVHEVHVFADKGEKMHWEVFESTVHVAASSICMQSGFPDCLWAVHLVDIYVCPKSSKSAYAIQIAYCSLTSPLDRMKADQIRILMEQKLPEKIDLE
jgi:hypothetical protein